MLLIQVFLAPSAAASAPANLEHAELAHLALLLALLAGQLGRQGRRVDGHALLQLRTAVALFVRGRVGLLQLEIGLARRG